MLPGGDCFTCSKVSTCSVTDYKKVMTDFVCPLFEPVPEPVYIARAQLFEKFGPTAVKAILARPQQGQSEEGA